MKVKVLLSRPFVGCREGTRRRRGWMAGRGECLFWGMFFFCFWDPAREVGKVGPKVKKKVGLPLMTTVLGDAYFNRRVLRTRQSDA